MTGGRTCGKTTTQEVAESGNNVILQRQALLPASGIVIVHFTGVGEDY